MVAPKDKRQDYTYNGHDYITRPCNGIEPGIARKETEQAR
jgi:hypothetical protein